MLHWRSSPQPIVGRNWKPSSQWKSSRQGLRGFAFCVKARRHMTEDYISAYGPYANKLIRLQLDLSRPWTGIGAATNRQSRSGTSTSTPGPRGWLNRQRGENRGAETRNDTRPHASGGRRAAIGEHGQAADVGQGRAGVAPAGRRRCGAGKGAGCTAGLKARAAHGACATVCEVRALDPRGCGNTEKYVPKVSRN